jgi:hypothetical protein
MECGPDAISIATGMQKNFPYVRQRSDPEQRDRIPVCRDSDKRRCDERRSPIALTFSVSAPFSPFRLAAPIGHVELRSAPRVTNPAVPSRKSGVSPDASVGRGSPTGNTDTQAADLAAGRLRSAHAGLHQRGPRFQAPGGNVTSWEPIGWRGNCYVELGELVLDAESNRSGISFSGLFDRQGSEQLLEYIGFQRLGGGQRESSVHPVRPRTIFGQPSCQPATQK